MITILQSNVPRCPKCSALMFQRIQNDKFYHICNDCLSIYQTVDNGQAEIEIIISDNNDKIVDVNSK